MATNNSVNNKLGPSNSLEMSSAGFMTLPQQPAFLCFLSTDLLNATGNGNSLAVPFDTNLYDKSNSVVSGNFTAPISGVYLFNVTITLLQATLSTATSLYVYLATDAGGFTVISVNPTATASALTNLTISGSATIHLNIGDEAAVNLTVSGVLTQTVGIAGSGGPFLTYFSGALLS